MASDRFCFAQAAWWWTASEDYRESIGAIENIGRQKTRCHAGRVATEVPDEREHHVGVPRTAASGNHAKKKSLHYVEQLDPEVQKERKAWCKKTHGIDPQRFVFLDESNAKTNMTRLYGRAPRGERVIGFVPDGRWESLTMLSALRFDGSTTAMVYEGGTDILAMQTYVEGFLAAALKPGDIVAMDNLSSHRNVEVVTMIEATGAEVWFLPRYSPDYPSLKKTWPIEEMWSKVKAYLRKVEARSKKALINAIGKAHETVTAQDAAGWFAHCGYPYTQS